MDKIGDKMKGERVLPSQVTVVKKILAKKHNLILPGTCDEFVARCLRIRDGKPEKAAKTILTYRETMKLLKEWEIVLTPREYVNIYQKGIISLLSQRDSMGRLIFIVRTQAWDPQDLSYEAVTTAVWMLGEYIYSKNKEVQVNGHVSIVDCANYNWQQAWAANHRMLIFAKNSQNGMVGKLNTAHFINHSKIVGYIYKGVSPFLNDKSKKKVVFHDNLESLHNFISPKVLPRNLGGLLCEDECMDKVYMNELLQNNEYFEEYVLNGVPSK